MQEDGGSQRSDNFINLCFLWLLYSNVMFYCSCQWPFFLLNICLNCLHVVGNCYFSLNSSFCCDTALKCSLLCLNIMPTWQQSNLCLHKNPLEKVIPKIAKANIKHCDCFSYIFHTPKGPHAGSIKKTCGKQLYMYVECFDIYTVKCSLGRMLDHCRETITR